LIANQDMLLSTVTDVSHLPQVETLSDESGNTFRLKLRLLIRQWL